MTIGALMMNPSSLPLRGAFRLPLVAILAALPLGASGFQLREQSPSAQGNAYAGISAGGTDVGGMFFNVATLTRFDGNEIVAGFSTIKPSARLVDGKATRATTLGGSTISGGNGGDAGETATLPALAALWSLSPDLKLGLSLNSPFGLSSSYSSGWMGRYHALRSEMTIIELAPSIAWRVNRQWSVGAALAARHVDAELSNAVDFGAVAAAYHVPGYAPGSADGFAKVQGKRWGLGWKAGVLFEPSSTLRFGASYRSAIDYRLKGDVHYEGVPAPLAGVFKDGGARPMANQPATASLGAAWEAFPGVTLQAETARTFWTHFQDIRIAFATGQADSVTVENWKDSWFHSVGATWQPAGPWTFRAGVALDQTPTTDTYRTPRIPDAERFWASVGVGYAFTAKVSMDVAYTHLFAKDSVLDLKATPGSPDFLRGNLSGTYHNKVDIVALQVRCKL
ncbi:aromatic hydrocarbon degradation protein [Mesoterricola sediminis]|uniref:Aromatic hydrocarbon degradation protein n=2 Tax=Mesoterricola sediminis TaxID=2927980 RepID=A0AA48HGU2_9BACT|nr:aromatic hydrocarbon degradation protein [Mesoterricola sediminis]